MSSLDQYRALLERSASITIKAEPIGLVSLALPTKHARAMAYSQAYDAHGKGAAAAVAVRRALTAQCIRAWSASPRALLGDAAQGDEADQVLPVSEEAAYLLADALPDVFAQLSDALFAEIEARAAKAQEAEKN